MSHLKPARHDLVHRGVLRQALSPDDLDWFVLKTENPLFRGRVPESPTLVSLARERTVTQVCRGRSAERNRIATNLTHLLDSLQPYYEAHRRATPAKP